MVMIHFAPNYHSEDAQKSSRKMQQVKSKSQKISKFILRLQFKAKFGSLGGICIKTLIIKFIKTCRSKK